MNVVLLNDTDGRENIGCRLTSSSLKTQLIRGLGSAEDPIELTAFPWAFGKGRRTGRVWRHCLSWNRSGNSAAGSAGMKDWLTRLAEQEYGSSAVSASLEADVVICHPEGSISDYHDAVRIMNLLSLPLLSCLNDIPTCAMNGTFPLFQTHDRRFQLIGSFLQSCTYVALRDRMTAAHYHAAFMPDAAILHQPKGNIPLSGNPPYMLITTGANLAKTVNLAVGREALKVCDKHRLKPLILTKKHQDLKPLKADVLRRGGLFLEYATLDAAAEYISQCALHIGGRYHMALLGLLLNVPSVLIRTNTHKNIWLAEEFNGIELVQYPHEIDRVAGRLYKGGSLIKKPIHSSVEAAQNIFRQELDRIACIISEVHKQPRTTESCNFQTCQAITNCLRGYDRLPFSTIRRRISRIAG